MPPPGATIVALASAVTRMHASRSMQSCITMFQFSPVRHLCGRLVGWYRWLVGWLLGSVGWGRLRWLWGSGEWLDDDDWCLGLAGA